MSESTLKLLRRFEDLPDSQEKAEASRQYQQDEIGIYELMAIAQRMLEEHKQTQTNANK